MIEFRGVEEGPLRGVTASAPDGAFIGLVGLRGSGKAMLLKIAAGLVQPQAGEVRGPEHRRLLQLGQPLDFSPVPLLALDATLACQDPVVKAQSAIAIERMRRAGATVLMSSYDEPLLLRLADEIWWLRDGRIERRGDPREVMEAFRAHCADSLAAWGRAHAEPLDVRWRRGDGRAQIELLEAVDASGQSTVVWRGGQEAGVRVMVRYAERVENPVLGIMIRTRVGFEVYGTNTELEGASPGVCEAGTLLRAEFRMRCDLCPGDYTITAASHDPDGTAHDWLDDAVAVSVADSRYTAGVANLRAMVTLAKA